MERGRHICYENPYLAIWVGTKPEGVIILCFSPANIAHFCQMYLSRCFWLCGQKGGLSQWALPGLGVPCATSLSWVVLTVPNLHGRVCIALRLSGWWGLSQSQQGPWLKSSWSPHCPSLFAHLHFHTRWTTVLWFKSQLLCSSCSIFSEESSLVLPALTFLWTLYGV